MVGASAGGSRGRAAPLGAPQEQASAARCHQDVFIPGEGSGSAGAASVRAEGSTSPGSHGHTSPAGFTSLVLPGPQNSSS